VHDEYALVDIYNFNVNAHIYNKKAIEGQVKTQEDDLLENLHGI
jgi:hypothetical protein